VIRSTLPGHAATFDQENPDLSDNTPYSSPLDPFLAQFLAAVAKSDDGFQPGAEGRAIASSLDVPPSFVDALFTSARTRGLLKPMYGRGGKVRWNVSVSGAELIRANQDGPDPNSG
jgi:hypothetical protein